MAVFADDQLHVHVINFMVNNKILGLCKLKAFPDNKTNVAAKLKIALGRVENKVEKRENAGYHVLKPFPSKPLFLRVCSISPLKTMWEKEKFLYEQFLLFLQCFPPIRRTLLHIHQTQNLMSGWLVGWLYWGLTPL